MRILFDVQIANPKFYSQLNLAERMIIDRIRKYVHERISVLQKEIDVEESENKKSATIVYLKSKAIQPRGYSKGLCDKINSCFSENHLSSFLSSLDDSLSGILN
jgi:hypothetical protein